MIHINNVFNLGDVVALRTDDSETGMITGINLDIGGSVTYMVSWGVQVFNYCAAQELVLKQAVENQS